MGLFQGLMGNYSQMTAEELEKEYGSFLMEGEQIQTGFKLVRDAFVITDRRILDFDKQGTTGQKIRVNSIDLSSIYHVTVETSGFGLDDSAITIGYIESPYYRANNISIASKTFEFPKKYEIKALYQLLQGIAYSNVERMNA